MSLNIDLVLINRKYVLKNNYKKIKAEIENKKDKAKAYLLKNYSLLPLSSLKLFQVSLLLELSSVKIKILLLPP